jgi:hypothetical protein
MPQKFAARPIPPERIELSGLSRREQHRDANRPLRVRAPCPLGRWHWLTELSLPRDRCLFFFPRHQRAPGARDRHAGTA